MKKFGNWNPETDGMNTSAPFFFMIKHYDKNWNTNLLEGNNTLFNRLN